MSATRHRIPSCANRHALRHGVASPDVSFIHPLALLGLTAAAIPALLNLLQRRIPPELDFPAVRYLSAAERESARRLKLRHLLLLILRTALIVAIVFAAARPLVSLRGAGVSGGAHEPTAVVVILDNSPSSGAVVDGGVMLERLRAAAQSSVRHTTSADRVWLMLCDGVLRGGTREALLATIDSTRAGWQGLDLVQAVERAARLVNAQPSSARPDATAVACISLSKCTSRPGDGWAFTRRAARSTACTRSSPCQPARVLSIVASSASRVPPRSTPSHNISHTRSADVVWRTEDCAAARSRSSMTPPSTTAPDDGELSRMTTTAVGSCAPPLTPAPRRLTRGRAAANTIATIKAVRRMSRRR